MGILDDELDDPTPTPVTAAETPRPNLKRRLPLKADLEVDRKKYKGERVSRADANVAEVEDFGLIVEGSGDEEDIDSDVEESSDGEDFGIDEVMAEHDSKLQDQDNYENTPDVEVDEDVDDGDDSEAEMRQQELAIKERLADEKQKELKRAAAVKEQKVSR